MLLSRFVRAPRLLPDGSSMPFGNGFSNRGRVAAAAGEDRVLAEADLAVVARGGAGDRIVERRPVQAVAAAQHGAIVNGVHGANPRRPLHRRRIALVRFVAVHARIHQAAGHGPRRRSGNRIGGNRDRGERALHGGIEADGEVVVLLAQPLLVLEAKTVGQRELRVDAPVVLGESAEVVREDVERRRDRQARSHGPSVLTGSRAGTRRTRCRSSCCRCRRPTTSCPCRNRKSPPRRRG